MAKCECSDPGCPITHGGKECGLASVVTMYRIDMGVDSTGVHFCQGCAEDAWDSGVFTELKR